jgi:cytidylate kinase
MVRVITISREFGSGGSEVARLLAERLFKALWQGGYEGVVSHGELNAFDADAMAGLWRRVIRESAQLGRCVIVGRGAQCLLEGREDVFHVSVFAEMEERVRNLLGPLRRHLPPGADPRAMAEESDARRAEYVRRYFGEDWKDYRLYQMVINSAVGFEAAATAILTAAGLSTRRVGKPSA